MVIITGNRFNKHFNIIKSIKSIRLRVFLIILLLGTIPTILIGSLYERIYENRAIETDINNVSSTASVLATELYSTGFMEDGEGEDVKNRMATVAATYSGRIVVTNSSLRVLVDTYSVDNGKTIIWDNVLHALDGESGSYYNSTDGYLVISVPIVSSEKDSNVLGVLLVTKSVDYIASDIDFIDSIIIIVNIIIFVIALLVAIFTSRFVSKEYRILTDEASNLASGVSDGKILSKYTETKEVYDKFSDVMNKMRQIDESRKEFVSNVSHELKTPLTSMKVLAESINSMGDEVPVELYKEFMGDITQEIDRETNIINDLLSLVKTDKSSMLNITSISINELIETLLKRLGPIASDKGIDLIFDSFRPITADVDEVKITLAISNLIENAIKYNRESGYVKVSINADHQYLYLKVEDGGIGISEEDLDFIFERFYRVDKSHSSEISGTGLGLAITKNIVDMHRGEIKVYSVLGEGTTFTVRIPLRYVSKEE